MWKYKAIFCKLCVSIILSNNNGSFCNCDMQDTTNWINVDITIEENENNTLATGLNIGVDYVAKDS